MNPGSGCRRRQRRAQEQSERSDAMEGKLLLRPVDLEELVIVEGGLLWRIPVA